VTDTRNGDALVTQPPTDPKAKRTCGIIMPISATNNQTEAHWTAVRTLISRAIERAGFIATPVWENSATDRVSERIIGNIFQFPIAVVDISDSNPNVMLELGLRIASKKPTVVVVNDGGAIPFDIRDFHAIHYPTSLSILEMESFIEQLSDVLIAKDKAANEDGYVPFLSNVVVDVIAPGEREVPFGQFLLDRLDEIDAKISSSSSKRQPSSYALFGSGDRVDFVTTSMGTAFFFTSSGRVSQHFNKGLAALHKGFSIRAIANTLDETYYAVVVAGLTDNSALRPMLFSSFSDYVSSNGATVGVPEQIAYTSSIF
jgi:hypothetical protein